MPVPSAPPLCLNDDVRITFIGIIATGGCPHGGGDSPQERSLSSCKSRPRFLMYIVQDDSIQTLTSPQARLILQIVYGYRNYQDEFQRPDRNSRFDEGRHFRWREPSHYQGGAAVHSQAACRA